MSEIQKKRDIVNRKLLSARIDELTRGLDGDACRKVLVQVLKEAYAAGFAEARRRSEAGEKGRVTAHTLSYLTDQLIRILFDYAVGTAYPLGNPTTSERLSLVATGGYGRGELAPYSDVDLLFLFPYKRTPWVENVAEFILYVLWDMGLKVGHAVRTIKECIRLSKGDLTIRTSLLDARYLWGDQALFDDMRAKFQKEIVSGNGRRFVEDKLAERDARHLRMGDTRYVVEPNIKEGKGGMRDLHTLFWISRFLYGVSDISGLVGEGVITAEEARQFKKAEDYLWTVRCFLHFLAGRGKETLTFDVQGELAAQLKYRDHPGLSGVERFMKHYFLTAKLVGDLTRVFCASLEARQQKKGIFGMARFGRRRAVDGFVLQGGRLSLGDGESFADDPAKLLKIFAVADRLGADIHPDALRGIGQNLRLIDAPLRRDRVANEYFMEVLTSRREPEINLRRMNEAGVFGRFIPDFGRVVAQMQHDMYHHYTVDEHTIRAIGLLSRIEIGELSDDHPLTSRVIHKLASRRVLFVAVLLHDIAKGRGGNHSILGEEIARKLCPRLGLDAAETDNVAWLVRNHLYMSHQAFKRDLTDPKTIEDFVAVIQSPERLRLLLTLTVVDIRAVGPGVWNAWKRQLLRELYEAAEEKLIAGHIERGRAYRVAEFKRLARARLRWPARQFDPHAARFNDAYWIAEGSETHARNARLMTETDKKGLELGVAAHVDHARDMTEVTVYAKDRRGLFARITGALAELGANIVDAKIFTTTDGMALDNFTVQDAEGKPFDEPRKLARIEEFVERAVLTDHKPDKQINRQPAVGRRRRHLFKIEPFVVFDNKASNSHTVLEINARDRTGLLYDLARVFYLAKLSVVSAHIATFGERAVDVFYVQNAQGNRIIRKDSLAKIERALLVAAKGGGAAEPKPDKKTPRKARPRNANAGAASGGQAGSGGG